MLELIVVDATVLISALLGGRAAAILQTRIVTFVTSEQATWEVKKYIPVIARKTRYSEGEVHTRFWKLPIITIHPRECEHCLADAESYVGWRDRRDVHVLAAALALDVPLWSDDRDFEGIPGLTLLKTSDMQELFAAQAD